jgi:hypothetical protein
MFDCFTPEMTPAGLEPAIPGSVGRCLIHWATGPSAIEDRTYCYAKRCIQMRLALNCKMFAQESKPAIAQLVEHLTVDICSHQMVPGSIPGGRTFQECHTTGTHLCMIITISNIDKIFIMIKQGHTRI